MLPNRKATIKSQLPGAMITAVAWSLFSYFFSIYFEVSSNFTRTYGNLAAVLMVMLWLYVCMNLLLYGAEIDPVLHVGHHNSFHMGIFPTTNKDSPCSNTRCIRQSQSFFSTAAIPVSQSALLSAPLYPSFHLFIPIPPLCCKAIRSCPHFLNLQKVLSPLLS